MAARFTARMAASVPLALGIALVAAGCFRDPDPFTVDTDDVAVHMILEAGADSVLAVVERPGDPVEEATVRLIAGTDTTTLRFSGPACTGFFGSDPPPGCHRAVLSEPVRPGATYELEVILEDGRRITGSTVVPGNLTMIAPAPAERVAVHCGAADTCYAEPLDQPPWFVPVVDLMARWEEPSDPDRLFGHVRAVRTFLGGESYDDPEGCDLGYFTGGFAFRPTGQFDAAADSMRLIVPNVYCVEPLSPGVFDSIHAEVVVQEISPSYEAYLDALGSGSSTREEFVAAGIEGAWGVFAGITATTVPVMLIREPPPTTP